MLTRTLNRLSMFLMALPMLTLLVDPAMPPVSLASTSVGGTIAGDTTWTLDGSPYLVTDDVTVNEGVTLTIEPGVVVKFNDDYDDLWVYGTLVADGTSDLPIIFTSIHDHSVGGATGSGSPAGADWSGLYFMPSSGGSVLDHVTVRYGAGRSASANVHVRTRDVAITNSTFAYAGNTRPGILFDNALPASLSDNTFTNNTGDAAYAALTNNGDSITLSGNSATGNRTNGFAVLGTISGTVTWDGGDSGVFPFVVGQTYSYDLTVNAGATLALTPGTVIKFRSDYDDLIVNGTLEAEGTAAKPIVFTSFLDDTVGGDTNGDGAASNPAGANWSGLYFMPSSSGSVLDYVTVRYGGGRTATANVHVQTNNLEIRNSTFSDVANYSGRAGIRVDGASPSLVGSAFHRNPVGIYAINGAQPRVYGSAMITCTQHGVYNASPSTMIDARGNWWGDVSGPSHASNPDGTGVAVSDGVAFAPWIEALAWRAPWYDLLRGTEEIGWGVFGQDDASLSITVTVMSPTATLVLGDGLEPDGLLTWNTTVVPDGWYALHAEASDGAALIDAIKRDVLVLNDASLTWHAGTITADETWDATGIHILLADVVIPAGVQVTVVPGAIVKANAETKISIMSGGTLVAQGTPTSPIVFTSLRDDVAGGDTNRDGAATMPRPGDWYGIAAEGTGQFVANVDTVVRYYQRVHSGTLAADQTWAGDVVHRIVGDVLVPNGVRLTIEPDAIIKFGPKLRLTVQAGGELVAQGTRAQPIHFTSVRDDALGGDTNLDGSFSMPAPGDWRDLNIEGQATLDHVILRYGAGSTTSSWNSSASLRTGGSSVVTLSNCRVEEGFFDGILAQGGVLDVSNCVVTGHDRGLVSWLSAATANVVNSTFDDNRIGLLAHGGNLSIVNTIVSHSYAVCVEQDIAPAPTVRYSNLWCPASQTVKGFTNPVGSNGNIAADPTYRNQALGDFRLRFGSPAVDAADGSAAPETDMMGAPRYDDPRTGNTGTPTPDGAYADMGAYELVESAPSDVDLMVSQVSGPHSATVGEVVTLQWTVVNSGTTSVRGPWHDGLALVLRPDDRPVVTPVGNVLVGQDSILGPGQSAVFSAEVRVPAALPGDHHWEVRVNALGEIFEGVNSGNNTALSIARVALDLPELAVDGGAVVGAFDASGARYWIRVLVPAYQSVQVRLSTGDAGGMVALYAAQGRLPDITSYDQRSDPQVPAPASLSLSGGPLDTMFYILAHAASLDAAPASFSLAAQSVVYQVGQVIPAQGGNTGTVTLAVLGSAFPEGATVRLRLSNGEVLAARDTYQSGSSRIDALFDLAGVAPGYAAVEVVAPGNIVRTLPDGFQVLEGGQPDFWVALVGPENIRAGRETVFELHWGNRGTVDAPVHLLDVAIPANVILALEPGGVPESARSFFLTTLPDGVALTVPPGYSASRPLYIKADLTSHINLSFGAVAIDAPYLTTLLIDWESIGPLARPPEMADERWNALWSGLTARLGDTWATMLPVLAENALSLNRSERGWLQDGVDLRTALLWELDSVLQEMDGTILTDIGGLAPAATQGGTANERIHYLGVFLQQYDTKWWNSDNLPAVGDDRKYVTEYLDKGPQVPAGRRVELFDSTATSSDDVSIQQILKELRGIASRAKAGETILWSYSGHGHRLGIVAREGGAMYVIPWASIYEALNASQAGRIVVVMDACFSGTFKDWLNTTANPPPAPGRWHVVGAAAADQPAYDGLFTRAFYASLGRGRDFWTAWQENRHLSLVAGLLFQNPEIYSADARFTLKDTEGAVKDGTTDGLSATDPSPVSTSGQTAVGVVGSFDPNEKQTLGYGTEGFVADGMTLNYTILFENDPDLGATAPVQELLIIDSLSADLDWSTFELTEMGFGAEIIAVPAGYQTYQTTADIPDDPYPVLVDVGLDPATGEVRWYFASRDAATQDLPEDPWAGFLPVNDGTGRGEGFVSFRIRPKAGLSDGAIVTNQATITFDPTYGANLPIVTDWVTNTLDLTPPSSAVQPLGASSSATFDVAWSGHDGGSGVAYYDVYVSSNGGTFSLWQAHTTLTTASFTGVNGATYSFYVVATDHVGHREMKTPQAESSTTVAADSDTCIYLPLVLRN